MNAMNSSTSTTTTTTKQKSNSNRSPQLCSSAPSGHSWMPLQCAVAGRQVWLEQRKPLQWFPSGTTGQLHKAAADRGKAGNRASGRPWQNFPPAGRPACELTAVLGVFVGVVLAVVVTVAHPALRYAVTRLALEAVGLARVLAHWGGNRDVKPCEIWEHSASCFFIFKSRNIKWWFTGWWCKVMYCVHCVYYIAHYCTINIALLLLLLLLLLIHWCFYNYYYTVYYKGIVMFRIPLFAINHIILCYIILQTLPLLLATLYFCKLIFNLPPFFLHFLYSS